MRIRPKNERRELRVVQLEMVHNRSMRGEKLLLVLYLCQKFKETAAVVVGFAVRKAQVGSSASYVCRER